MNKHDFLSILTGLERPVQPQNCPRRRMEHEVSILTGLERPVQPGWSTSPAWWRTWFQSSPALKDRCNVLALCGLSHKRGVSILTGLERPVQRLPHSKL